MIKVVEDGKQAKATAERLFNCLVSTFEEYDVPLENIFACCFDGSSTMTGRKTGLKAKLEAAIPGIICVRCPAHSTHLCVMHALHEIPNKIMTLFNNINAMLKSSNRVHDFTEVQRELGLPEHKILKLCMTRWLSLEKVSARYVEQYPALLKFATKLAADNDQIALEVLSVLEDQDTKCYFLLFQKVLSQLNALNRVLQRKDVVIHKIKLVIENRYKNIMSCVLNRFYVLETPAADIDLLDSDNYLAYEDFE